MEHKWIFLLVLILCCQYESVSLWAQGNICGWIIDQQTQDPLIGALIMVKEAEQIITHEVSDHEGGFCLSIDLTNIDTLNLELRYLGYQTKTFQFIAPFSNSLDKLPMQVEQLELGAIEVVEQRIIRQKGDTTIIQAAHFADGTERSVEELLKKIPGIEVDEDGTLSYKGKVIERVLIEGDDLFGRQYTVGTKNISSEIIEEFEFIDHFVENKHLRNVIKGEDMALNLKVKKQFKYKLAATARIGLGTAGRRDLNLNSFLFGTASKGLLILGNENVSRGLYTARSENLITELTGNPSKDYWTTQTNQLISTRTSNIPNLEGRPAWKNNDRLATINNKLKLNDQLKWTVAAMYEQDLKKQFLSNEIDYLDTLSRFSNQTISSDQIASANAQLKSTLDWDLNANNAVRIISQVERQQIDPTSASYFRNQVQSDSISQQTNSISSKFRMAGAWTKSIDSLHSIQLLSNFSEQNKNVNLGVRYGSEGFSLSNLNEGFDRAQQEVSKRERISGGQLNFFARSIFAHQKYELGYKSSTYQVGTELSLNASLNPNFLFNDLNQTEFKEEYLWLGANWNMQWKKNSLNLKVQLRSNQGAWYNEGQEFHTYNRLDWLPTLTFRHTISDLAGLSLSYSRFVRWPAKDYFLNQSILGSARSIQKGTSDFEVLKVQTLSAQYSKSEKGGFNYLGLLVNYNWNASAINSSILLTEWLTETSYYFSPNRNWSAAISARNYSYLLKGTFEFQGNYFRSTFSNIINESQQRNNTVDSYRLYGEYSSGFPFFLNFLLAIKPSWTNTRSKINTETFTSNFNNLELNLRLLIKASKSYNGRIGYFLLQNLSNRNHFLDFNFVHTSKGGQRWELSGRHLLSGGRYNDLWIGDFSQQEAIYHLTPEYIMISTQLTF